MEVPEQEPDQTSLPQFSKIRAQDLVLSDDEDAGMSGVPGVPGGGAPPGDMYDEMEDFDFEACMMDEENEGESKALKKDDKSAVKKLIKAGVGWENPKTSFEVVVKYVGRLEDGTVFDAKHKDEPWVVCLGDDGMPEGWGTCLKTMRKRERALLTLEPSQAFGASGSAKRGVPPNATVEYELELIEWRTVEEFHEGSISKKMLHDGEGWDKPEGKAEVSIHYVGKLMDGTVFESTRDGTGGRRAAGEPFVFEMGSEAGVRAFDTIVSNMKRQEVSLVTVKPEYAFGEEGDACLGVPPNATVQLEIELLGWSNVEDMTDELGEVLKKTTLASSEMDKPRTRDDVFVQFVASVPGGGVLQDKHGPGKEPFMFVLGAEDAPPVLNRVCPTMNKGQKAVVTCTAQHTGGMFEGLALADGKVELDMELIKFHRVENVPQTEPRIIKKTIQDGLGYERPNDEALLHCKIVGKLPTGGDFDCREGEVVQGEDDSITEGVHLALREMKQQERAIVTIPPEYAYGAEGHAEKGVPPNCTLTYEMELFRFEKVKETWEMDTSEKLANQEKKKEEGNILFKAGKYKRAIKKYEKSNNSVCNENQFTAEDKEVAKKIKLSSYLNLAACHLKMQNYTPAIKSCDQALELDKENCKALFRRGQAYLRLGNTAQAKQDLLVVAKKDPKNKEARKELERIKEAASKQKKTDRGLYAGMFDKVRLTNEEEKKEEKKEETEE